MTEPSISVIIRNRNEADYLQRVLAALALQDYQHEIVLVDNESTDRSIALAQEHQARIVKLAKDNFSYGRALNLGLAQASGEISVILSAHSLPIGNQFLRECARPFADPKIAAVRCLYAGKAADQERWLKPELLDASSDIATVISKGPLASGCAIRNSVWQEIKFDEQAIAAEEKLWALQVLKQGYQIYSPCSAVYAYLKKLSPGQSLVKNSREVLAVYQHTGLKTDFARRSAAAGLIDIIKVMLYHAPITALGLIERELLKTYFRMQLKRDNR